MGLFRRNKKPKLFRATEKLLESSEREIAEAKKIQDLYDLVQRLNEKKAKFADISLEINVRKLELLAILAKLDDANREIEDIKQKEKVSRGDFRRTGRLGAKVQELRKEEQGVRKKLEEFKKKNIMDEEVAKYIEKLDRAMLKAWDEINRRTEEMLELKAEEQAEEMEKLLEAMEGKIFP